MKCIKIKRAIALMLSLCMILSILSISPLRVKASDGRVDLCTDIGTLKKTDVNVGGKNVTAYVLENKGKYILSGDLSCDETIVVKSETSAEIDLCGHKLTRKGGTDATTGNLLYVEGSLELLNSGETKEGLIYGVDNGLILDNGTNFDDTVKAFAPISVMDDGFLYVENVSFSGNCSYYGGVIYNKGFVKVEKSVFADNTTKNTAAAIFNNFGGMAIMDTVFKGNKGFSAYSVRKTGSAICLRLKEGDRRKVLFSNCTFESNGDTKSNNDNGVINATGNNDLELENCTFKGNHSAIGGALYLKDLKMARIIDCSFSENSAEFQGGAIYADNASIDCRQGDFKNNSSHNDGVVLYATATDEGKNNKASFSDSYFHENSSMYSGGVYYIEKNYNVTSSTCIYEKNFGSSGGVVYNRGVFKSISDQYVNNSSYSSGSAIYNPGGDLFFKGDTSIINNESKYENGGYAVYLQRGYKDNSGSISMEGSLIIKDNKVTETENGHANLFIPKGYPVYVTGELTGSKIHFSYLRQNAEGDYVDAFGKVTSGYEENNYAVENEEYFIYEGINGEKNYHNDPQDASSKKEVYIDTTLKKVLVHFEANEGVGEMNDEEFYVTESETLSKCEFTREGFAFLGWATEKDGTVVYSDEQAVIFNEKTEDKVTLYAVWGKMADVTINVVSPFNYYDYNLKVNQGAVEVFKKEIVDSSFEGTEAPYTSSTSCTLAPGLYNISVANWKDASTTFVEVTPDTKLITVYVPNSEYTSRVMVSETAPKAVAAGPEEEAKALSEKEENRGRGIDIALYVSGENMVRRNPDGNKEMKAITEKLPEESTIDFMDISVVKTSYALLPSGSRDVDDYNSIILNETSKVFEVMIPYNCANKSIKITRYHGGVVQEFAQNDTKNDQTFYVDKKNNVIHLFASKFCTYAISYVEGEDDTVVQQYWPVVIKKDEDKDEEPKVEDKKEDEPKVDDKKDENKNDKKDNKKDKVEDKLDLSKLKIRLYSKYVMVDGKRVIRSEVTVLKGQNLFKTLLKKGYKIETTYYRGTVKDAGKMDKMRITNNLEYTNTVGDNGQMYYYRAIVKVYAPDGRYVGKTKLSNCKYANRVYHEQRKVR